MKWLLAAWLWVAAGLIAVAVVWRWRRGRNIVLRGKWSPRFVRMVVIVLVMLGLGCETATPVESGGQKEEKNKVDTPSDELPASLTSATIQQWMFLQTGYTRRSATHWPNCKILLSRDVSTLSAPELFQLKTICRTLPPSLATMLIADMDAQTAKQISPALAAGRILALYDECERLGYYDHWLNAYLWRKTAGWEADGTKQMADVYARMHRHARITDALIRAQGEVKPYLIPPRAWMSKAMPGPAFRERELKSAADVLAAAKAAYPAMDGGTWKREGVVLLTLAKDTGTPQLLRAGRKQPWPSSAAVRLGRLDLIETPPGDKPVVLEHDWLGKLTLPVNRTISAWQLPGLLSDEGRATLKERVAEALSGDEEAADKLELALPLAHMAIRTGVAESPQAKLAPRLRMLLALYDDTVMPAVAIPNTIER